MCPSNVSRLTNPVIASDVTALQLRPCGEEQAQVHGADHVPVRRGHGRPRVTGENFSYLPFRPVCVSELYVVKLQLPILIGFCNHWW